VPVLVAAGDLPEGTTIRADDVQIVMISRILADSIPGNLPSKSLVIGLTIFVRIFSGQLLFASFLTSSPRHRDVSFPRPLLDPPLEWPLHPGADEERANQRQ
jgi:hypothetical protein